MTQILQPETLDEALAVLAAEDEAMPMSGGATLVAMKNARLVEPTHLVSLDRIAGLRGIATLPDGRIRIGAMTRHFETASSALLTGSLSVLRQAAGKIANRVVRNMGTMGGSVANADPAADYLPALACCDAVLTIARAGGERELSILDYVEDWYETALEEGEVITAFTLPAPEESPSAYRKIARVTGDFATASCAMALTADGQGIRVAIGACGPGPLRDPEAEQALIGKLDDPDAVTALAERLVAMADPIDDVRGTADYRLALIPRLVRQGLDDLKKDLR
ncbi:FAD binding domain-containing protein [Chachezhania sediminis]|uniref:FAD binding domain-containing protein n=1 Tax=Chachezhania sediminis TaxID=2599291 RepID=UPI00131B94DA|nr:xanthine dehydrogenase family protein subunit M [Chachezhania sediminis]